MYIPGSVKYGNVPICISLSLCAITSPALALLSGQNTSNEWLALWRLFHVPHVTLGHETTMPGLIPASMLLSSAMWVPYCCWCKRPSGPPQNPRMHTDSPAEWHWPQSLTLLSWVLAFSVAARVVQLHSWERRSWHNEGQTLTSGRQQPIDQFIPPPCPSSTGCLPQNAQRYRSFTWLLKDVLWFPGSKLCLQNQWLARH